MYKRITFLLYILCFVPFVNFALAQKATISGTVTNFDNEPVDFVSVSVQGSTMGTFTNQNGKYQLTVSTGDSVTVVFSAMGYQRAERILPLVTGNMTLNVMLRERPEDLEEVTVVGEARQTTTMERIKTGDIRLMADPSGGSVETIIASQAGVSSTNELSSQYSVRGGNYDENIVYVNGIEIYRPLLIRTGQQEGLSFINPDMTQSVGFSSGGFDAVYGDKMSSVLDITYKKPRRFESSVSGSLLGGNAYIGSATKKFTQITGIRYKTTRNLLGSLDTDAEYDPSFLDVQTYMTFEFLPRWEISFLGNYSDNIYKFTPITRSTSFGTMSDAKNFTVFFDGWEHDRFQTSFGALTLKGKLTDNLEMGVMGSAFSSHERERYDIGGEYELTDANLDSDGGEGETGVLLGVGTYHEHARNKLDADVKNINYFGSLRVKKHYIRWGATIQQEEITDKIKEWEMRDSAGYSLPNNGELVQVYSNLISDNKIKTTRYSGYIQDTYRFSSGENLYTLNVGFRGSYWSFNKEFLFSPRASFAFIPAGERDITLRFATGIYYQSPFYKEIQRPIVENGNTIIELNENIKSQKSVHFVVGGDYAFRAIDRPFKFTTEVYYKNMSDLIPYTVDNVKIRYSGENSASGYVMGLDMKLFGEFVAGTDSWITFSLMKAQQDLDGVKAPLPTEQRYNMSLFFQDYLPGKERLKMTLIGHFSQGLPTTAPNKGYESGHFRAPAYKRVDIGFLWELLGEDYAIRNRNNFVGSFRNIWLGVDIFNLFDIKNTSSYYWVDDIFNQQYAVPNYLTGRRLNFKFVANF